MGRTSATNCSLTRRYRIVSLINALERPTLPSAIRFAGFDRGGRMSERRPARPSRTGGSNGVPPAVEAILRPRRAPRRGGPAAPQRVRGVHGGARRPIINVYWGKAEFPFDGAPGMAELGIAASPTTVTAALAGASWRRLRGPGDWPASTRRWPPSWASTASGDGVESTCAAPRSRRRSGSRPWPGWKKIGAFGLTEPDVGSGGRRRAHHHRHRLPGKGGGDTWTLHA